MYLVLDGSDNVFVSPVPEVGDVSNIRCEVGGLCVFFPKSGSSVSVVDPVELLSTLHMTGSKKNMCKTYFDVN